MSTLRADYALDYPNDEIAQYLRDHPGGWYLVAGRELDKLPLLRQTAYRIRHGLMEDFPTDTDGRYEARLTARKGRREPVAPVELTARFVPTGSDPGAG